MDKICTVCGHITNKVRGILCPEWNHGLGKFKDNITNLRLAIEYLEKSRG